jgi:hypothetical protein
MIRCTGLSRDNPWSKPGANIPISHHSDWALMLLDDWDDLPGTGIYNPHRLKNKAV